MQIKKLVILSCGALFAGLLMVPGAALAGERHGGGYYERPQGNPPVYRERRYHQPRGHYHGHRGHGNRPARHHRGRYYLQYSPPVYYPPHYRGHRHHHDCGHVVYGEPRYRSAIGVQLDGFYFGFSSGH